MVKDDDDKPDTKDDEHSLDMSQAAVKKMIANAKARGYITYDELNEVLPPEQVTSEQIEDVMAMLSEMGINTIESDEGEEEERTPAPEIGEGESLRRASPSRSQASRWSCQEPCSRPPRSEMMVRTPWRRNQARSCGPGWAERQTIPRPIRWRLR